MLDNAVPAPAIDRLPLWTLIEPPEPPLLVLLSIVPPPAMLNAPTLVTIVPAFPEPVVEAEIFPPPPMVNVDDTTFICPAFPDPAVVVKRPLLGLPVKMMVPTPFAGPTPDRFTEPALMAMLPPAPNAEISLL